MHMIPGKLTDLISRILNENHVKEILSGAFNALIIKVLSAAAAFLFNVLIARLLGVNDTGIYYLSLTIVVIGATIGRAGLDNIVLRFVASNSSAGDWVSVLGVYRLCMQVALFASLLVSIALVFSSAWIADALFAKPELEKPLVWMTMSIVPIALFTLHAQALQGLKEIKKALAVQGLWQPLCTCVGVVLLVPSLGIIGAVYAYTVAAVIALVIGWSQWRNSTKECVCSSGVRGYFHVLSAVPSLLISSLLRIIIERLPLILLGVWATASDAGVFGVASRIALLISFILVAVNSISAPKFAALYDNNQLDELESVARFAAILLTFAAIPLTLICYLYSEHLMAIFGDEFVSGADVLVVLALGQFVNVVTGPVGYLLVMTGHERDMRNNMIFCTVLNLILCFILIESYGAIGAACAVSITVATQNIISLLQVWKRLGILVLPIPLLDKQA